MNAAQRFATAILALPLLMTSACGTPGAPQPPSLKLPDPVADLTAARHGDQVHLHWTMPKRATDKVLLKGDQATHICRRVESGPCETAADLLLAPLASADFTDHLPPSLTSQPAKLLIYTIELRNPSGHTAGPSNRAYTVTGAAPEQPQNFAAVPQDGGIVLKWKAADGEQILRIHRVLVAKPGASKPSEMTGSPIPPEQILEVSGKDTGHAIDRDAPLDHTYRYTIERVAKFTLSGYSFDLLSEISPTLTLDARDIFPPRPPQELQAVADPEARAIDLSWPPNTEPDLAGYIVYRRELSTSATPVRISAGDLAAPAYRDLSAQPGHKYAYSVGAIDRDGNESARSAETEETLPQQ